MRTFLSEHLRSKPLTNIDGKFIDRRKSGNQRDARSGAQRSEIKLFPYPLIRNSFNPGRDTRSTLDWPIRSRSAMADSARSTAGERISSQESFRERIRHKGSRSCLRAQIALCVEL